MKFLIVILLGTVVLLEPAEAQKEDYVWVGGQDPSTNEVKNGIIIDFNENGAKFQSGVIGHNFHSFSASICDENGHLLFYTNGCAVLDSTGSVIENGDSLNYNEWFEESWLPDCQRLGYPGAQSTMILPSENNDGLYYLLGQVRIYNGFSVPPSFELHYSVIDLNSNKVLQKNIPLVDSIDLASYYLTAIPNLDQDGFYIYQPLVEDSTALVFELNKEGLFQLNDQNLQHFFTGYRSSSSGTARFSPDGTRYAFYNYYDGLHIYGVVSE